MAQKTVTPHFRPPKPTLPAEPHPFHHPRHSRHAHLCVFLMIRPLSPATPLQFSGVPFSWEHLPGIPKNQSLQEKGLYTKGPPTAPACCPCINLQKNQIRGKLESERNSIMKVFEGIHFLLR
ncbi:hypothetical protein OIU78_027045 [Salix suchowensis]|nr:hypothetical protein OIU78_027045 [Salix suchowensis]